ncbi:uncharacterized protein FA14DRAFT_154864 [Meira miltonrushii]|uniref:Uncharacterized protein n=1 Tax=Meira miltonrushii TaxID=1280837 RepID=A0A316VD83_9BASI|nr:uncharacterized protein FA14DRAFT_154864 [Meira miltonrushii]PWN35450.1 hypothetical protein FA14DRAFT_154864 [Meira miltonrushii]
MKTPFITLFVIVATVAAEYISQLKRAPQPACPNANYNIGQSSPGTLDCGPGKPPCVAVLNSGKIISQPIPALKCDPNGKVCQYPDNSMLTVECPQKGKITVQFFGDENLGRAQNDVQNAFAYFMSQHCTRPSRLESAQAGDTFVVDCDGLLHDPRYLLGGCMPYYDYNRKDSPASFGCGPGKGKCVTIEGKEGKILLDPKSKHKGPIACDQTGRFCTFKNDSRFFIQCNQGTYKVHFGAAGKKNHFDGPVSNSYGYWMSQKCSAPNAHDNEQLGDLLVVNCNPLGPQNV